MRREQARLLSGILLALLATIAVVMFLVNRSPLAAPKQNTEGVRIVSLSPGVTETIFALGAEESLVGVSDYCEKDISLQRVGSAISPNYEAIVRLSPSLIATTKVVGSQLQPLEKLAPTLSLPWLTVEQFISSVGILSDRLGRAEQGALLQKQLRESLQKPAPNQAPRVVWTLDLGDSGGANLWFVRDDSIHGAVLRAAGGRNAVSKEVLGQPLLTVEELVAIDPDILLVVVPHEKAQTALDRLRAYVAKLSVLSGVRIVVVEHQQAMSVGPSVLLLIEEMEKALEIASATETTPENAKRSLQEIELKKPDGRAL